MAVIRRVQLETVCPRGEEAPYLSDLLHYVRLDAAAYKRTIIGIRYVLGVGVGDLRLAVLKGHVFPNPQLYGGRLFNRPCENGCLAVGDTYIP